VSNAAKVERWMKEAGCERIRLSASGNFTSTCPYHAVKDGTQFAMHAETGLYVCYSSRCGAQGNIYTFLVEACGWSPQKAIGETASFARGLDPEEEADTILPDYDARRTHGAKASGDVIHAAPNPRLLTLYDRCPKYLLDRGFTKDVLKEWEIGFDTEAQRATIPVRSGSGLLVGFSKRAVWEEQNPKYLHLGFSKGQHLYGEHRRPHGVKTLVVTEGQLDAIAFDQLDLGDLPNYVHLAGRPGDHPTQVAPYLPVSTMGSRVTTHQIDVMRTYSLVFLAFDSDRDGQLTTFFVGDQLLEKMGPGSVYVLKYPEGVKDMGSLVEVSDGAKQLRDAIHGVVPYDEWRIDNMVMERGGRRKK
jgi:DNA primase